MSNTNTLQSNDSEPLASPYLLPFIHSSFPPSFSSSVICLLFTAAAASLASSHGRNEQTLMLLSLVERVLQTIFILNIQGSAKRSADFVKQQPGRSRQKS